MLIIVCGGVLLVNEPDRPADFKATGSLASCRRPASSSTSGFGGKMLDEALDILTAVWSVEPPHHLGQHYIVDGIHPATVGVGRNSQRRRTPRTSLSR